MSNEEFVIYLVVAAIGGWVAYRRGEQKSQMLIDELKRENEQLKQQLGKRR
jgi:hypothetical protein